MTIIFAWWAIPAILTIVGLAWAFWWPAKGDIGGLAIAFRLIPILAIIAIAWAIAGAMK